MASNPDFVQYIVDQCADAGDIFARKMMGDYCIYCNGVLFGSICDNNLYIKVTDTGRTILKDEDLRPPYNGAKPCFYIADVDDRDYMADLIRATLAGLSRPVSKRGVKVTKVRQVPTSLDDVIAPNIVCSQDLRPFFEKYLGTGFRFKVEFQEWLHANAGRTFREAIDAYKALQHHAQPVTTAPSPEFFYIPEAPKY